MLGIRFMKANPTNFILHYSNGKLRHKGAGVSFFYYEPTSTIVSVPIASQDAPFAFTEATSDFQTVTLQGQLTFRVADPEKLASLLNLTIGAGNRYLSDDYQKVPERLVHSMQVLLRAEMQGVSLREALTASAALGAVVLAKLRAGDTVTRMGLEVLNLSILCIRPTPEMAKALEAEAREALQRRSDEAIYARRNAAVEQERRIKESELNTEIAVEEKRRQVRETQMAAEIALEEQRAKLMDQRVENERKEADSRAYALGALVKPVRDLDWRTLMMLSPKGGDPSQCMALAFQELASNAQKIGEVNFTPDLVQTLLRPRSAKGM